MPAEDSLLERQLPMCGEDWLAGNSSLKFANLFSDEFLVYFCNLEMDEVEMEICFAI